METIQQKTISAWEEVKGAYGLVKLAYALIFCAIVLAFWFLVFGNYFSGEFFKPDPNKARDIQPFISGLVLPLLSLGSTLLVIANLRSSNIQNFSNNFFKLIDQHHRLVGNIDSVVEGYKVTSRGNAFFDDLATRIAWDYDRISRSDYEPEEPDDERYFMIDHSLVELASNKRGKALLMIIYDHYFHIYHSDLSHYFRNLFHIVKFVERSSISQELKFEYLRMLRAQLSNYELLLIAYDGMHEYGQLFYPLIEKYELIKSVNNETRVPVDYEKRIVDINILKEAYPHLAKYWNIMAQDLTSKQSQSR